MDEEKKQPSAKDDFFDTPTLEEKEKIENAGGMVALNTQTPPQTPPQKQQKFKVGYVFGAIGIALASFLGGYFTYGGRLDAEMRSLINAKDAIDNYYYTEIDNDTFYATIFSAINNELLDPYSGYMTADEYAAFNESATGKWSGLGLTFVTKDENGEDQMLIARVSGNSPAQAQGILDGDKIIGFGATEESIVESKSFDEFSLFLQGYESDQPFVLKIQSGEQTRVVTIAKQSFVESYVLYRSKQSAYTFGGENATELKGVNDPLSTLPEDTAYVRLTQFNGSAAEQFASTMSVFKQENKKNLVLDLRSNGGGYLDILCEIAAYFCKDTAEKNPVVAISVDKNGNEEKFSATKNLYNEYFQADSRICVLADASSASASECLIGAMLDYKAIAYGDICLSKRSGVAKTYGKGIMQATYPFGLVNSDAIKLTTARICWPLSKNCIHGRGVLPEDGTQVIEESYQKDAELNAALAALGF